MILPVTSRPSPAGGLQRTALAVALVCAAATGPAMAQSIGFAGSGVVDLGPPLPPPGDLQPGEGFFSLAILPASTAYTLNGQAGWSFQSQFTVRTTPQPGGALAGSGTVSSFSFTRGVDSLFGVGTTGSPDLSGGLIGISYTVTGGTGAYAGFIGTGGSLVQLFGPPAPGVGYAEFNGLLSAVPEPAAAWLLAGGLLALGARRRSAAPVRR